MTDLQRTLSKSRADEKREAILERLKNPLNLPFVGFGNTILISNQLVSYILSWAAILVSTFVTLGFLVSPHFFPPAAIISVLSIVFSCVGSFMDGDERKAIKRELKKEARRVVTNKNYEPNLYKAIVDDHYSKPLYLPKEKTMEAWTPHHIKWVQKQWDKALVEATREEFEKASGGSGNSTKSQLENIGRIDDKTRKHITYSIESIRELQKENKRNLEEAKKTEEERFVENYNMLLNASEGKSSNG